MYLLYIVFLCKNVSLENDLSLFSCNIFNMKKEFFSIGVESGINVLRFLIMNATTFVACLFMSRNLKLCQKH